MTGTYAWKYNNKADAQKVGSELDAIYEEHGKVTPELVVEDARKPDRETHQLIEWDDPTAAGAYRRDQARYIMRNIIVVHKTEATPDEGAKVIKIPVYTNVDVDDGRYYLPIRAAMERDDTRTYVLKQALRDLSAFRHKYGQLTELANVFTAIDKVETEFTGLQIAA